MKMKNSGETIMFQFDEEWILQKAHALKAIE